MSQYLPSSIRLLPLDVAGRIVVADDHDIAGLHLFLGVEYIDDQPGGADSLGVLPDQLRVVADHDRLALVDFLSLLVADDVGGYGVQLLEGGFFLEPETDRLFGGLVGRFGHAAPDGDVLTVLLLVFAFMRPMA